MVVTSQQEARDGSFLRILGVILVEVAILFQFIRPSLQTCRLFSRSRLVSSLFNLVIVGFQKHRGWEKGYCDENVHYRSYNHERLCSLVYERLCECPRRLESDCSGGAAVADNSAKTVIMRAWRSTVISGYDLNVAERFCHLEGRGSVL
jgi:hypothetical protein